MTTNQIINAAPMVIDYGTEDLSSVVLPREPEAVPQHLPKFYLFAEKGPLTPQLVVGPERQLMFGGRTFDLRDKFANHSTVFANEINAEGNICMIQRVVPDDAGPRPSLIAWLDVLACKVDLYQRNSDGSIKLDIVTGDPILNGQADGYKVKWVVTNDVDSIQAQNFGQRVQVPGDQVHPITSAQSVRYPIYEFRHASIGSGGNDSGIRLWAPTKSTLGTMPMRLMSEKKVYPYFLSVIHRSTPLSTPKVVETVFAEQRQMVTLKRDVVDPVSTKRMAIEENAIESYQNLTDLRYPIQFGEFGAFKLYYENLEEVLALFHAAEIPFLSETSDFTAAPADKHLFNLISGVDSSNVPYHSYIFVDSSNTVRFSEYTNVYANGGSDGTMNNATHSALVKEAVLEYLNPDSPLQENATHVESVMYDTGFPLETKLALASFIAVRKDTCVLLTTHTDGQTPLTASEEYSLAVSLRNYLKNYPESDYFGTGVSRGLIMGRSARLRGSAYIRHLPLLLEFSTKAAAYMGASNGRWKNGAGFDGAPGSIVTKMYDINITWVPNSVRNRNWDAGLNWVQAYDTRSYYFPAYKTVYEDDTSVLNSFLTVMAICQLNKIAHAAHREYAGSNLPNLILIRKVNDFVTSRVQNRFDNRFIITPQALMTEMDLLRGFSWTLPIKIEAAMSKTVMTTYTKAYRLSKQ